MAKQFTLQDFNKKFQSEYDCLRYLFNLKWKNGFSCLKCGHTQSWKGRTQFNLRCRNCRYDESVLANTVFHKIKIPLLKAFGIAFHVLYSKKGMSSLELSRRFGINLKSAWYFRRKLQQVLFSSKSSTSRKTMRYRSLFVDSILISGRKSGSNGLQQVHLAVEEFTEGNQKCVQMSAQSSLPAGERKLSSELVKGKFRQMYPDINIWNFKVWLTGTHHHCSVKYLQGYIDEFLFRHNYRNRRNKLFGELINKMIHSKP